MFSAENIYKDNYQQPLVRKIANIELSYLLKSIDPYKLRAQNMFNASDIVRSLLDLQLRPIENELLLKMCIDLAVAISKNTYGGCKSEKRGIDLEFFRDGKLNIVAIKSGPNWGNASQIRRMRSDFEKAAKTIRTSNSRIQIRAINGCCYGADNHPDKGGYLKYCGQKFWEFISGNPSLYVEIIEPLGHKAKEKNDAFLQSYAEMVNRFVRQFSIDFCDRKGAIDWKKLVQYNSADRSV